jgi:hypothetical protein
MTTCQEATEVCLEKAKAGLEEVEAAVDVFKERLDKMDAMDLEANQEKLEAVVVHQEVPKEEAAVKTVRALKEHYGDQHLAIGHCRQLQKWTQGDGGSRTKPEVCTRFC